MQLSTATKTIIGSCLVVAAVAAAGAAVSPAGAGEPISEATPFAINTCASSKPCITYKNTTTGPGLKGFSVQGSGLLGSNFGGSKFGGVEGTSDAGNGVLGISDSNGGVGIGVLGQTTGLSGDGGDGVVGTTPLGAGVLGVATYGYGVQGQSGDPDSPAIYGSNTFGVGVMGFAPKNIGLYADGGFVFNGFRYPALFANYEGASPGDVIQADSHNAQILSLDDSGNLRINGLLYTAGGCHLGCSEGRNAVKRVVSYAPSESQPSMEDFGKAQLVDGRASVRLDAAFQNVIDSRSDYLVFITPEGDSRGLYVTAKTPSGFSVRENQGGRSTLAFDYRIVAKPYADASKRLPMIELPPAHVVKHNPRVKEPRLPGLSGALALP